jgi:hypothetical protein
MTLFTEHRDAQLSRDGLYRYRLFRGWGEGRRIVFVMLNPSTADASFDDPTIRRCRGFAKRLVGGSMEVVNLYALRATKPEHLLHHPDPIGPENVWVIQKAIREADLVVAAWGANVEKVAPLAVPPIKLVMNSCEGHGVDLTCLGETEAGHPRHPLYLPSDASCVPWLGP